VENRCKIFSMFYYDVVKEITSSLKIIYW
jgi:hypothetical protein